MRGRSGWAALGLLALFALSLALRLSTLPEASRGGTRLLSPDCWCHLRRSVTAARSFPRINVFDAYMNPPDGAVFIWPPLLDLAVGGTARLLHGPRASWEEVARVAAALPPVLGSLNVLLLFVLARRLLGPRRAWAAAAAYAVLPSAVLWSVYGHADHHVAEVTLLLASLLALASAARPAPGRVRLLRATLAGAALAAGLLVWQGAVFSASLGLFWAVLALGPLAVATALSATGLLAAATAGVLGGTDVPFTFVSFGWFQPAFLLALSAGVAFLTGLRARRTRERAASLALALVLALALLPVVKDLAAAALRGSAYLAARSVAEDPDDFDGRGYRSYPADYLAGVHEARPLLSRPRLASLVSAVRDLSPGLLVLPFAVLLWAVPLVTGGGARGKGRLLLALFGGVLLLMVLGQRRNLYYAGVFTALALADASGRVLARLRLLRPRWGAPALAFGLVLLPGWPHLARIPAYSDAAGPDFLSLLARLKELDPPPADPADLPQLPPGSVESVFCPWSAGHFVTAIAWRPAAADPHAYGWRRQCRLYTATDDGEALSILRSARSRYLLTANLRPLLPRYAAAAGRAPAPPVEETFAVRVHESASRTPVPFLALALESRTGWRAPDGRILPSYRVWKVLDAPVTPGPAPPAAPPAGRSRPAS